MDIQTDRAFCEMPREENLWRRRRSRESREREGYQKLVRDGAGVGQVLETGFAQQGTGLHWRQVSAEVARGTRAKAA